MEADLWEILVRTPLYLDQTSTPLELDREEVARFYEPLARLALARRRLEGREIVAVAGPPGSGKSAFATTLTATINALAGEETAVMAGLDGWHFPNAYLDSHTVERAGERAPLRTIKGAPGTYDQQKIRAFLSAAHSRGRLVFPVYSRERHDPIPEGGTMAPWQKILVLEGNYWLLGEPPWNEYRAFFDLSIFLKAEAGALIDGLRERHLRGGKSPEFVEEHMREVDLPNIERVLNHSGPADVVVHKADSRRIERVERSRV